MTDQPIRIGTRGSALAMTQARLVADALEGVGHPTSLVKVSTAGDRRRPDTAWGEGAFVAALEEALLEGRVDLAVHSAKDVPTDEDNRLRIGAYLERADARDALVVRAGTPADLHALPAGARVGTDSPRRTGFLLACRPDLTVHPLHGNVDTRLRRLDVGETDALVLACAGLDRLGLGARIGRRLEPDLVPPAPGQGAIAVQLRAADERLLAAVAAIDDRLTRVAVEAERAFLAATGGGCRAPIGALAAIRGNELELLGGQVNPDGSSARVMRLRAPVADATRLALELARALGPLPRRVLVTRPAEQAATLATALREVGLEPVVVPAIEVQLDGDGTELVAAARDLDPYAWIVITSGNGARALVAALGKVSRRPAPRVAVIGDATRTILEDAGIPVAHQPTAASALGLARSLPLRDRDRVLVVRGTLASDALSNALRARGATVDEVVAYATREAPDASRPLLREALADGPLDALIFASGSAARGLAALARAEAPTVMTIPAVCIGQQTAAEAARSGFRVLAVASAPESEILAATTAQALAEVSREKP